MQLPVFSLFFLMALHSFAAKIPPKFTSNCENYLSVNAAATDIELLMAIHLLETGFNPENFSIVFKKALFGSGSLYGPTEINSIKVKLIEKIAQKNQKNTIEFTKALGGQLQPIVRTIRGVTDYREDLFNGKRGFGWQLLPVDDPVFYEPQYLYDAALLSGAGGNVMGIYDGSYEAGLRVTERFSSFWKKLAPKFIEVPSVFFHTGSDAVNYFYDIAQKHIDRKLKTYGSAVEMISFTGIWGGTRGRIRKHHNLSVNGGAHEFQIESPLVSSLHPSEAEVAAIKPLERKVLLELKEKIKNSRIPIGGILLEPIIGAGGVYFYREEFLLAVQKICHNNKILIFADEVLTGGGRTGKFFAFEHYKGFVPDYISFGKGLLVAGVASTIKAPFSLGSPYVTQTAPAEVLNKSAQVLKAVYERKLIKNAAEVGKYFLSQQKRIYKDTNVRGVGLLFHGASVGVDAHGRFTPYLTLTKSEALRILREKY